MEKNQKEEFEININLETTPILYTDQIFLQAGDDGVTIDVCQKVGNSKQMRVVARIGMSRSHAKKLIKSLDDVLLMTEGQVQTGKKLQTN